MLLWHDVLIVGIIGMHVTITVYVINQQGFFFTGLNLPIRRLTLHARAQRRTLAVRVKIKVGVVVP